MNEDRRSTDERIAAAARELYNAPPATPREEMWAELAARLEARPGETRLEAGSRTVAAPHERSAAPRRDFGRVAWWMGVAAALVIGLGIGRLSLDMDGGEVPVAGDAAVSEQVAVAPGPDPEEPRVSGTEQGVPSGTETPAGGGEPPIERATAPTDAPVAASDGRATGRGLPYVVATREHLNRSELFLTGVRAHPEIESADPEMESWARALLTRTRILMASPAGEEPATRRLLEDLELMLAQVVATAATQDAGEARIVGENLEESGLLYRLRSAARQDIGPAAVRASNTSSL